MKKIYVAGFLFSKNGESVALVEKQKPDWQKGKLNGIGGKVEEGETPAQAMQREFKEEAGLDIADWTPFCVLTGNDAAYVDKGTEFEVHFFSAFDDEVYNVKTIETEVVSYYSVDYMSPLNLIPNLKWLIPLALEPGLIANVIDEKI